MRSEPISEVTLCGVEREPLNRARNLIFRSSQWRIAPHPTDTSGAGAYKLQKKNVSRLQEMPNAVWQFVLGTAKRS
jgi:hypothetical protein